MEKCDFCPKIWFCLVDRLFYVTDNGPGIEEKHFDTIFQLFQKVHKRSDLQSAGIGLPIVKKIIQQAGGNIYVKSKIGVGSAFYFEIPKTFAGPDQLIINVLLLVQLLGVLERETGADI